MPTPMENGYVMVAERHAKFIEEHPDGVIINNMRSHQVHEDGTGYVIMECQIWKKRADADGGKMPDGVGHAGMPIPGPTSFTKNSEVENAETSALGRALAMIGYHPKESLASEDEITMKSGSAPARRAAVAPSDEVTPADKAKLMAWGKRVFGDRDKFKGWLESEFDIRSSKDIKDQSQLADIKTLLAITDATKEPEVTTASGPSGVELDDE